jgi:diazepam-binding inhibitor (GABA receptor modulating acyl-CoA-binding protein)
VQLTFEQAAERVKTLKDKPSNDVLLQIYGLYKQATVGDNTGAQPWAVQVEARAKWEAWTSQKGSCTIFPAGARLT